MKRKNKMRHEIFGAAALVAASVVGRTSFAAYSYTLTDVGSALNGDSYTSQALGLNSSDQVVGYYYTTAASSTTQTAFVYNFSGGTVSQVAGLSNGGTTEALGINNAGVVVGENTQPGYNTGGFYATPANYGVGASSATLLPVATLSGGTGTILYGVGNDTYNTSVGAATTLGTATSGAANRGIVFNTTNLNPAVNIGDGFSGPVSSTNNYSTHANFAIAMNTNGDIAGYGYNASTGLTDAYVATPTGTPGSYTYTDIGTAVAAAVPGALGTYAKSTATGINTAGDVVGTFTTGGATTYAYFYNGSNAVVYTNTLSGTAGQSIRFTGINDSNQIVGYANSVTIPGGSTTTIGFELDESTGVFTPLDNLTGSGGTYQINEALAINNNGDIVGYGETGTTGSGTPRAILLTGETAVPEPASLGLLGFGAAALLGRRRSRRLV